MSFIGVCGVSWCDGCRLFVVRSSLLAACLLRVVCCSVFVACCLFGAVRCVLFLACGYMLVVRLLVVGSCLSFGVRCLFLLCVVCYLMFGVVYCCCVMFVDLLFAESSVFLIVVSCCLRCLVSCLMCIVCCLLLRIPWYLLLFVVCSLLCVVACGGWFGVCC